MKLYQTIRIRNNKIEVEIQKVRMDTDEGQKIGYLMEAFDITKEPNRRIHYQFTPNKPNINHALAELTYN